MTLFDEYMKDYSLIFHENITRLRIEYKQDNENDLDFIDGIVYIDYENHIFHKVKNMHTISSKYNFNTTSHFRKTCRKMLATRSCHDLYLLFKRGSQLFFTSIDMSAWDDDALENNLS